MREIEYNKKTPENTLLFQYFAVAVVFNFDMSRVSEKLCWKAR